MTADSDNLVAKLLTAHIASRVQSKSATAQSSRDLFKRLRQILAEQREITLYAAGTANHDVVSAAHPKRRQHFASKRTKTPLHPVTDNRIADLFGNRDAKPHRRISIGAIPHKQNETTICRAFCRIGGKKILARADCG